MSRPLDIDAIEARAEAATEVPWGVIGDDCDEHEHFPYVQIGQRDSTILLTDDARFIAAARTDVPALCQEVRQLRQALAAVEKAIEEFRLDVVARGDFPLAAFGHIERLRAAASLGAAVTPTPQEGRLTVGDLIGPISDEPDIPPTEGLRRSSLRARSVTSTPEAATDEDGMRQQDWREFDAEVESRRSTPSGLQRATEQAATSGGGGAILTSGMATLATGYPAEEARVRRCKHGCTSAHTTAGAVEAWADHVTAVAVGGSDTPADQPEPTCGRLEDHLAHGIPVTMQCPGVGPQVCDPENYKHVGPWHHVENSDSLSKCETCGTVSGK